MFIAIEYIDDIISKTYHDNLRMVPWLCHSIMNIIQCHQVIKCYVHGYNTVL